MSIAVLQKLCSQIPWCELAVLEPTVELALEELLAAAGEPAP